MTQGAGNDNGNADSLPTPPLHTKLDIQRIPEDAGGGGDGAQNAATIILTPTSLNLTNTTQNVAANNAGNGSGNDNGNGNGSGTVSGLPTPGGVHGDEYKGPKW